MISAALISAVLISAVFISRVYCIVSWRSLAPLVIALRRLLHFGLQVDRADVVADDRLHNVITYNVFHQRASICDGRSAPYVISLFPHT